jgi:uncharacterized repeat protein (TIGR01451 family)
MKKILNNAVASLLTIALPLLVVAPSFAADPQWTATSSGASKNANAGYIAPFGRRIVEVNNTGAVKLCFERVLGDTGSINVTLTTYNAFNVAAGTHYTALSGTTLSWADGVVGVKCTTLTVSAMPTGPGIIGIDLGGNAYRDRDYVLLNNGTVYASAKYVQAVSSSDATGNTNGSGTSSSPWQALSYALNQIGNTCGLLYVRGAPTINYTYADSTRGDNHSFGGSTASNWGGPGVWSQCAKTNPLIVMAYPSETVTIDQGSTTSSTPSTDYSPGNVAGFVIFNAASNVFLTNMTIQNTSAAFVKWEDGQPSQVTNDVNLYKLTGHYQKTDGSNSAGIGLYYSKNTVVQDCTLTNVYSSNGSQYLSNPYDSVPMGLGSGTQQFRSENNSFIKNTVDVVQLGIYQKFGPDSTTTPSTGMDVSHNLFLRVSGSAVDIGSTNSAANDSVVRYNVSDNPLQSGTTTRTGEFVGLGLTDNAAQNQNLTIYNNVGRYLTTLGLAWFESKQFIDTWVFNNIMDNVYSYDYIIRTPSQQSTVLTYTDYNDFYAGSFNVYLESIAGYPISVLSNWQIASSNARLGLGAPDAHSVTTAPNYTNAGANDYRITSGSLATAGRFGRPIGVGNETVGALSVDHWDGAADLSLSATAIEVSAGISFFHLTLSNAGPANASAITISTTLPGGAALVTASSSGNCTQSGQTVTCTATALANGTSMIFTIAVSSSATQPVNLSFTASSNNTDANNSNNTIAIAATPPTFAELLKVQQFLLSRNTLMTQETQRLDVYPAGQADGVITFSDLLLLQKIILGI